MREVWSPTLWHLKGSWWIYFTAKVETEKHAIYVLQSDTDDPLGSYTYRGALDLGREAIDPSLLTVKGRNYLVYAGVGGGENAIYMVELANPLEPVGDEALIAEPEYPWEKGAGSAKNYPVNEGPTALYHAGKTFLVYSGSETASTFYCLGLLTFQGGDPLERKNWIKTDHPILTQNPAAGIVGTGRGAFAHAADGTDWLLYAAMPAEDARTARRAIRAQPFTWNADGSPNFGVVLADGPIPQVRSSDLYESIQESHVSKARRGATRHESIQESHVSKARRGAPGLNCVGVRIEPDCALHAVCRARG